MIPSTRLRTSIGSWR